MIQEGMALVYGARVGLRKNAAGEPQVIQVEQTIRRRPQIQNSPYVIDHDEMGKKIERFVNFDDDQAIAEAVRDACQGQL